VPLGRILLSGLLCLLWGIVASTAHADDRFHKAIRLLTQVPTGQGLIQKALKLWSLSDARDLADTLKFGQASRTDTVLTRHFNPKTGKEEREREITVFLREDQTQMELVLDMAHELVHATSRPSFDPYDPSLTVGKYIFAAIEGEGGEVDAVIVECQIGLELSKLAKVPVKRCESYQSMTSSNELSFDREKVRRDFYRVGDWKAQLEKELKSEFGLFPLLSEKWPKLYSSTGHAPYPLALLREYQEITELACDNSRIRMRSVESRNVDEALDQDRKVLTAQQDIQQFLLKRCN